MKVIISGYYGFGNVGDEAVLEAITQGIKNKGPEIEIAVLKRRGLDFIRQIREADLLISGGGTLFQDATSKRSFYYYAGIILLAKLLGKKIIFFAQGFGPLQSMVNRGIARFVLDRVDLITLRDEDSMQELKRIGVKKTIHLTADPTLILEIPGKEEGERILKREGIPLDKPLWGVSVRSIRRGEGTFANVGKLAETLDRLIKRYHCRVVFLPFQCPEDLEPISKVMDLMREESAVVFRICHPQEMLAIISRLDMLIGMRLHALIFAAMTAVPMLGISYDPKVEAFMKFVEQPYVKVDDTPHLNVEYLLTEHLEEIIKRKDSIRRELEEKRKVLLEKANLNFELLRGVLK